MRVIIHDMEDEQFNALQITMEETDVIYSDMEDMKSCIGCFGCWVKTPGRCVIKDGYENIGRDLAQSEKVLIISRCVYGSYSPFVKNVLDRSISYALPFFVNKNHEMHHQMRYNNSPQLEVVFYNKDMTEAEVLTAQALVEANRINMNMELQGVHFCEGTHQVKEVLG